MFDVHVTSMARIRRTLWILQGCAAAVGVLGLLAAALGHAGLSFASYAFVLVLGTILIASTRWLEARASLQTDYSLPSRWQRRVAMLPVVLLLAACLCNAFSWATEVAKR